MDWAMDACAAMSLTAHVPNGNNEDSIGHAKSSWLVIVSTAKARRIGT
jgi:hypothetical protein